MTEQAEQPRPKHARILIALAAAVALFATGNYGLGFAQWTVHWWADVAWTLASLATGLQCLRVARRQEGQYRTAWRYLGAGCLAWFAGMLFWDYQELIAREITPFPAWSDFGFLAAAPLWMIGMLWYRAEAPAAPITLKQICNLGIILCAIAIVIPVVLSGSFRGSHESPVYLAVAVAYPILYGAALVFGLTCLWLYVWNAHRSAFLLVLAGIAVHAATNTLYAAALLGRAYEVGNYLDVYWIAGFALLFAAGVIQSEPGGRETSEVVRTERAARSRELENVVSAAMLVLVAGTLYAFADNLEGVLVHYLFPLGVTGIVLIGIKEWWSDRIERSLQRDLMSSLDRLRQNEARLAGILEIAPEGIISIDRDYKIVLFNKGAERIFGYSEQEALGQGLDILIPDRFRESHRHHVAEFAGSSTPSRRMDERTEVYGRRRDGSEFPAEASLSRLQLGEDTFFTVVLRDVTERRRAAETLRRRQDMERLVSSISAQLVNLAADRLHVGITRALGRLSQFLEADRSRVLLFSADHATLSVSTEWRHDGSETHATRFIDRPAEAYPWLMPNVMRGQIVEIPSVAALPGEAAAERDAYETDDVLAAVCVPMVYARQVIGFIEFGAVREALAWKEQEIGLAKVVTEMLTNVLMRRRAERTLEEQAIRDPLTNLYNRRYFNQRFQEEIGHAERKQHALAVLVCDLDHFKHLNDSQGHQAGDQVLKNVAKCVNEAIRGADSAFRWGGDEITVLLANTTKEGALVAAQRIRDNVGTLNTMSDRKLDISIGIALFPEHGRSADDLVRLADRALYIAKKGGDKIHIGEEEYQLREDTVRVVFQPVHDLRLNEPVGFEALSRDAQGKLGILDLFKKYKAIGLLDDLKCLCFTTQVRTAQQVGLRKVFINVDFAMLARLEPPAVPPGLEIVLEISEAEALHDVENHLAIAKRWRVHGYKFAIDDFGAGFVSLPFIARLIPEHIKLDRSTVLQAVESSRFRRILKDMLLGLRNCSTDGVIAEGIESAQELEAMRDLGIYLVQGYLLGKPEELRPRHDQRG